MTSPPPRPLSVILLPTLDCNAACDYCYETKPATPVGTTVARIEISPGRATATGPQLQSASGPDAERLVEELLGWRLPVTGLADWIDGRSAPDRPATTLRDGDSISEIVQDGWTIRISEYSPATQRPRRLLMDRPPSGGGPALSVRLIVDDPH